MSDLVDRIKQQVSCLDFAERIGLAVNSRGYCNCPFHHERTASMRIYPENRGWYCFGCNRGGDVISMAKEWYKTDFQETVKRLADEFGIDDSQNAPKTASEALRAAVERAKVKSLMEREKRLREAAEAEYWALFDKWLENERIIDRYAPQSPDDDFDERFVMAVANRDLLKEELLDAEGRRNRYDGSK